MKYFICETYGECVLFESSASTDFVQDVCRTINIDTENGKGTDIENIFHSAGHSYKCLHDTTIENIRFFDLLDDNQDAVKLDLEDYTSED